LAHTFDRNARKDYAKWDCDAMYPMPIQNKVSIIKILTDAVKEGFAIFNEVKGMLPEGTMENLKIPGLPEGMKEKVGSAVKTFKQAEGLFKQFAGSGEDEFADFEEDMDLEEDLIEERFIGGESDAEFAKRVALRNRYVATCTKGKKEFAHAIGKTIKTLQGLGSRNEKIGKSVLAHIDDTLAAKAVNYKNEVYKFVSTNQDMIGSDEGAMKALHAAAWANHTKNKKFVHEAKKKALIKKAMLLQTGQ